jgi:hypothetical protein
MVEPLRRAKVRRFLYGSWRLVFCRFVASMSAEAQSKPLDDPDGGSAQASSHIFKFVCGALLQRCEP